MALFCSLDINSGFSVFTVLLGGADIPGCALRDAAVDDDIKLRAGIGAVDILFLGKLQNRFTFRLIRFLV